MMTYRPDIDGLRAAAILPVLFYHAGLPLLPGGFVGVDVFFVISGYLITRLILDETERGVFSLAKFYERRIRRILPALVCMIAACLCAGWFLLAPGDYRDLGRSAMAALLSFSNFLFLNQSGYFDTPAAEKPLLHTWSLGIEEQFYLVFPIYLLLLSRYLPRWRFAVTATLCLLSLWQCIMVTPDAPIAAFFLPHTRAWELLLGALVAMRVPQRTGSRWPMECAAALGLGLIALAVVTYSDKTSFPGWAAAVPAVGSALVISYGAQTRLVGFLLSRSAPVFIGKISYSLYLWHLPLFAFGTYLGLGSLSPINAAILLAVAFGVSIVSWRFVEVPARRGHRPSRRQVLWMTGAGAGALYTIGMLLIAMKGVPDRIAADDLRELAMVPDRNTDRFDCYAATRRIELSALCAIGAKSGVKPSFIVWGDSHAEALRPAIEIVAARSGRAGVFAGEKGCPPLIGVTRPDVPACSSINAGILTMIESEPDIRTVILIARWGILAEGTRYKAESGPIVHLKSDEVGSTSAPDNHAALNAGLERTTLALRNAGKEVWVVGPVPEVGFNVPRYFFLNSIGLARDLDIRPSMAEFEAREAFAMATLRRLADQHGLRLIFPHEALCDAQLCQIQSMGRSLYYDDDHLSRYGAESVSALFEPAFGEAATVGHTPVPASTRWIREH